MHKRIILRFRDLVTEDGGTISEHKKLIDDHGEAWWGCWMKQYETPPQQIFEQLRQNIKETGPEKGYLFNSGTDVLFVVSIGDIKIAPRGMRISSPDLEKSPDYYHRGKYPVWFQLKSIELQRFEDLTLSYDSFPTKPELHATLGQLLNQKVSSLAQLKHIDVTIWVVQEISD